MIGLLDPASSTVDPRYSTLRQRATVSAPRSPVAVGATMDRDRELEVIRRDLDELRTEYRNLDQHVDEIQVRLTVMETKMDSASADIRNIPELRQDVRHLHEAMQKWGAQLDSIASRLNTTAKTSEVHALIEQMGSNSRWWLQALEPVRLRWYFAIILALGVVVGGGITAGEALGLLDVVDVSAEGSAEVEVLEEASEGAGGPGDVVGPELNP